MVTFNEVKQDKSVLFRLVIVAKRKPKQRGGKKGKTKALASSSATVPPIKRNLQKYKLLE